MEDSQTTVETKTRKRVLTPGKDIQEWEVYWDNDAGYYRIKNMSGAGRVPSELGGLFTTKLFAKTHIDNYKRSLKKRG